MPRYTLHSKTKIKICFSQVVTKQQKVVIITILKEKKIKAILKYLPKKVINYKEISEIRQKYKKG